MSLRLLHRRRIIGGVKIPNFDGYNVTRLFALFKSPQATIDYPLKIDDAGIEKYVFFDDRDEISLDSPISETTTRTTEKLGDLVVGSNDIIVTSMFCLVSGIELSFVEGDPAGRTGIAIVKNGVLVEDEGRVALYFQSQDEGFKGAAIPEFNGSFSTFFKAKREVGANVFCDIVRTSDATFKGYTHRARSTNSSQISMTSSYVCSAAGSFFDGISYFSANTVSKNIEMNLYVGNVLKDSVPIAGNITFNDNLIIGRGYSTSGNSLQGYFNMLAISNRVLLASEVEELDAMINVYFI